MAGLVFVTLGLSWLLCCCTQAQPPPLDAICDSNGRCTWHGSGWYRGCVSDMPVLTFNQFNDGGLLDLRCSEVQVLSIESSTLTCADMKAHVITHTAVTIYLGESQTECHISPLSPETSRTPHPTSGLLTTESSKKNADEKLTSFKMTSPSAKSEEVHPTTSVSSNPSEAGNVEFDGKTLTILVWSG
ncbi:uncharacterized protein LOC128176940 [Crassostrea angulata]|uniref:uncharacterized protein LOC128176940 n=1 Tax=Magallana angulata TaxID=2784310 RepID=UPI0022B15E1E|nr:uncharacterized protein LOC128176940 [Crassostrea angulata]